MVIRTGPWPRVRCKRLALLCALMLAWTVTAFAADSEGYVREAEDYLRRGEPRAAVIQLKNALQRDPKNVRARVLLGKTYLKLGQAKAAEQAVNKARTLGAEEREVLAPLGEAYLLQGRYREVLDEIQAGEDAPAALQAAVLTLHARAELALGQRAPAASRRPPAMLQEPFPPLESRPAPPDNGLEADRLPREEPAPRSLPPRASWPSSAPARPLSPGPA